MENTILDQQLQTLRYKMDEIVKDLHHLTIEIDHKELSETVGELRNRINEPFMFVIVGEVKAGKSSFINALLDTDREICKVAPDPCTDTVQQIIYGSEETSIVINPYLKKIFLPFSILKEIAIVDTPGTNTIIQHHQEITEKFVPGSDLIVFVFEAKNPYRQSAWDFFDYIHTDWLKKIIFVLQQADLLEEEDLKINEEGVKKFAQKKGISSPHVFSVSAKLELAGKKETSGFAHVKEYIQQNITGGKAPFLKLANNLTTAKNISARIRLGMQIRQQQLQADQAFRQDILETLNEQERRSIKQVGILVENLLAAYDRITKNTEQKLSDGLGFFTLAKRSILSVFSKETSPKKWFEALSGNLETDLQITLTEKLNEGVVDIAESIQQMAKMIDLKIKNSRSILKDDHAIFGAIADRRSVVLRELQEQFAQFMKRSENFTDSEIFPERTNFSPDFATGGGLAIVGVVLATVTQGMVFDITGGVITTVGFLFAGITVAIKRKKIMHAYKAEIAKGRAQLASEVNEKLKAYIKNIKIKIDSNFNDFDLLLEMEEKQVHKLTGQYENIEERMLEVENEST